MSGDGKKTMNALKLFLAIIATIFAAAIAVGAGIVALTHLSDARASREGLAALQELAEDLEQYYEPHVSALDAAMREINPDFICWIRIGGTRVDHPVVRGPDNEKYLSVSFTGEESIFGTLFMDYRNVGEVVPHIIIYGHNSRDGEMFGELWKFLDDEFLEEHNIITLIVNDRIVEYEIFSARITDIHDPAYHLDFSVPGSFSAFAERNGAPPDVTQIITLSTCLSGGDDDKRVIIQGALRQ
ncbi:MAG: class B sortase [Oscillospiraceae bacterium]|nr:class B sortase [Oscillospiraceae bacterium]